MRESSFAAPRWARGSPVATSRLDPRLRGDDGRDRLAGRAVIPAHESTVIPAHASTVIPKHESTFIPAHESTFIHAHASTVIPAHAGIQLCRTTMGARFTRRDVTAGSPPSRG
jgi:hypothetical protein